jgi:hypothetical protein
VLAIAGIAILPLAILATIYATTQLDDLDAKLLADARPYARDVLIAAKALGVFGMIVGALALAALAIIATNARASRHRRVRQDRVDALGAAEDFGRRELDVDRRHEAALGPRRRLLRVIGELALDARPRRRVRRNHDRMDVLPHLVVDVDLGRGSGHGDRPRDDLDHSPFG